MQKRFLVAAIALTLSCFALTAYGAPDPHAGTPVAGQIDVAMLRWGGSGYYSKGQVTGGCMVSSALDGLTRTRTLAERLAGSEITIELFKPVHVTYLGILSHGHRDLPEAKDITIRLSSGRVIKHTLQEKRFEHHKRGAKPAFQYVKIDEVIDSFAIETNTVYPSPKGKHWSGYYTLSAFTDEDIRPLFKSSYNTDKPRFIQRTRYEVDREGPKKGATFDWATLDLTTFGHPGVTCGVPVKRTEHPMLFWSPNDIAFYQEQFKTNPRAAKAWEALVGGCENHLKKPASYPAVYKRGTTEAAWVRATNQLCDLASAYVLSDGAKTAYGTRAHEMFMELADSYSRLTPHKHQGMTLFVTWQYLSESMLIARVAFAYDILAGIPGFFTDEEKEFIKLNFFRRSMTGLTDNSGAATTAMTNWSAYIALASYVGGIILDDDQLIEWGRVGQLGRRRKGRIWGGGIIYKLANGIDDQGFWAEPAPGYVHMASAALIAACEVAWNQGENWYAIGGGNLRRMMESDLIRAMPDRTLPALEDSGTVRLGENMYTPLLEYAAQRYVDNDIIKQKLADRSGFNLNFKFQAFLPSRDFNLYEAAAAKPLPSINFSALGYLTARGGAVDDPITMLFDYSREHSHGHPDKLQVLLWAHDHQVMPDSAMVFYTNQMYARWYSRTGVHNTVSINNNNMKRAPVEVEVLASADELHLVQAAAPHAYPATLLERTTLLAGKTLLDVYSVRADLARYIDYSMHFRGGTLRAAPASEAGQFFKADPFQLLAEQKKMTAAPANARYDFDYGQGRGLRYTVLNDDYKLVTGRGPIPSINPDTFVVTRSGESGHFFSCVDVYTGEPVVAALEEIPTADARVFIGKAVFADGGAGYVFVNRKDNPSEGVYEHGYIMEGHTAYLEVDADKKLRRFVYAGVGGTVAVPDLAPVTVGSDAIILVNRHADGFFTIRNANNRGPAKVTVEIDLPIRPAARLHACDGDDQRISATPVKRADGMLKLTLDGFDRYELTDSPTSLAAAEADRRAKAAEAEAAERAARMRRTVLDLTKLYEGAAAHRPAGVVAVAQAEDFSAQEFGKVRRPSGRPGTTGGENFQTPGGYILGWDVKDHRIEWQIDIPRDGYYAFVSKYCSETSGTRTLRIDGKLPHRLCEEIPFQATGGYSRSSDQWQTATIREPATGITLPIHLSAGRHTVSLTNTSGTSQNMDWLAFIDYRLAPTRTNVEKAVGVEADEPDLDGAMKLYAN